MDSPLRRTALIFATLVFTSFASPAAAQQSPPDSPPQSVPPAPPPDLRGSTEPAAAAPRHRWVNTGGYLTPEPRQRSSARSSPKREATPVHRHSTSRHAGKSDARAAKPITRAELSRCKSLTSHQLKRNSKCQTALREQTRPGVKKASPAVRLSKAELRRCKALSSRQLRRNAKCQAALSPEAKTNRAKERPAKTLSKAELRRCQKMSYTQLLRNRDCAAQLQRELNAKESKNDSRSHKSTSARPRKATSSKDRGARQAAKRHRS